eukprot:2931899-Heterocapsa_arctica.AAC.1
MRADDRCANTFSRWAKQLTEAGKPCAEDARACARPDGLSQSLRAVRGDRTLKMIHPQTIRVASRFSPANNNSC